MMKMMKINLLILLWTLLMVQQKVEGEMGGDFWLKHEYCLTRPYQGSKISEITNWGFLGDTIVTDKYIRLTSDRPSQAGALWNVVPVNMLNWEAHVQFKVHGKVTNLFGDGFAFWYTKDRMTPGPVFGSKDFFSGLAVFVDTYGNDNDPHNHDHPYISAMVNNGSLHYEHDKDGTSTQLAGCERTKLRNPIHDTWMSVRYEQDVLTVSTDTNGLGRWEPCFRVVGVTLPTNYYFGFSAATGQLSDNHELITFNVYELQPHTLSTSGHSAVDQDPIASRAMVVPAAQYFKQTQAADGSTNSDPSDQVRPAIRAFIMALSVVIAIIAVGIFSFGIFQSTQEPSSKRFY